MLTTAALLAATVLGAAATAPPATGAAATVPPVTGADIAVGLASSSSTLLLPGARFDLSITNHGPEPLTSATVVVRFGADAAPALPPSCAFDGATEALTCTFGALPAGGTATASTTVYFLISGPPTRFSNTATRTASTPADPDSANDTASVGCSFQGSTFPPLPVPSLYC